MRLIRKLYDWVLHWADTPYGSPALLLVAFSEAIFFPIPPDVLLIPLALDRPRKAFYYAALATFASASGAITGYLIGAELMQPVGYPILRFYGLMDKFEYVATQYRAYDAIAVGIAGLTPIPFKVFTIAAGACKLNIPRFLIAAFVSRGLRFFTISTLLFLFGERIKNFIDRYFNLLTIIFAVLLVGGFIILKRLL